MATDTRRALLVTGKPLPVTALNDFGGQALQQGFEITVYTCGPVKATSALDRRICVVPIKVRGRTRLGRSWPGRKLRGMLSRVARRGDVRKRTLGLALLDAELVAAAADADVLVAVDPDAALAVWCLSRRHRRPTAVLGTAELARIARADRERELAQLDPSARQAHRRVESWQLELHAPSTTTQSLKRAHALAQGLIREGFTGLAVTVADEALGMTTGHDLVVDLRYDRAFALLEEGTRPEDFEEVVDAILSRSDEHWTAAVAGAPERAPTAARRLGQALTLLFHRALHTSAELSPLVPDPEQFLKRLRASALYAALQARPRKEADHLEAHSALLLTLSGSFFTSRAWQAAEQAGVEMREARLDRIVPAPSLGLAALLTQQAAALAGLSAQESVLPSGIPAADVWLHDWADLGAAWASAVPADQRPRLIVRLHSVEALSASIHVIDWSRVDLLITVSPFLLRMVRAIVPAIDAVPSVVIGHGMAPLPAEAKDDAAWRTLGMVGWGQVVKDPLFTIETLRELRIRQPERDWQLRLVGATMDNMVRPWDVDYARRLDQALRDEAVAGAVTQVGYTHDVAGALASIGFICSSSLRESFHVGLAEGAVSGCVPVVRDWPVVAPWGGAADLFPVDWVVQTPQEAAERILSTDDPGAAGEAAAQWVLERYGGDRDLRQLGAALRGIEMPADG